MPLRQGQSTQRRARPLARRPATLGRSSSFFGSLKSIISTPLSWFGAPAAPTGDDFQVDADDNGKRRRIDGPPTPPAATDYGGERQVKRKRMNSPEAGRSVGYLDPPRDAFSRGSSLARLTQRQPSRAPSTGSLASRTMSMDPRASVAPRSPPSRESSVASVAVGRRASLGETAFTRASTWQPARPPSLGPITRDYSMPPVSGPPSPTWPTVLFRMRSSFSVTPQPHGQEFGPSVVKKEREPSEPPALSLLRTNPAFVRPPSMDPEGHRRSLSVQPTLTLGTIAERMSRSPVRQQSTLIIDDQMSTYSRAGSEYGRSYTPMTVAEKALHKLDIYKTPLLPTRLRMQSPAAVPEMLRQKKVHVPVPMKRRKGEDKDKPRLGMKRQGEAEPMKDKEMNGSKPYAGESSAKKLRARQLKQEAEALEREAEEEGDVEDAMLEQDEQPVVPTPKKQKKLEPVVEEVEEETTRDAFDIPPSEFQVGGLGAFGGTVAATGRIGRSKTSRQHSAAPDARPRKGPARFSAADDDDDDMMGSPQTEAATLKPIYTAPANFSFAPPAPSVSATFATEPMASSSKEAPIESLPFSLGTKPKSAFALPPTIGVVPATPEAVEETPKEDATPKTAAGVPNFFAKTSAFNKPLTVTPPTTGSLFGAAPSGSLFGSSVPTRPQDTTAKFAEEKAEAPKWLFGAAPSKEAEAPKNNVFTGFGKPTESAPTTQSLVGSKSTETSASTAPSTAMFSFGAPSASTKPSEAASPSLFQFGQPAAAKSGATRLSNLGSATSSFGSAMSFDSAPSAPIPAPAAEAPKALFSFGSAPAATSATGETAAPKSLFGAPAAEAPKPPIGSAPPLTSSFSFGAPTTTTPETKKETPKSFAFGAAPATPVFPEKSNGFSFGGTTTPAVPPPSTSLFNFGASSPATPATPATSTPEAGRPFSFGVTTPIPAPVFGLSTPTRPVTPPKKDDGEISMEESPLRGAGMDLYGNASGGAAKSTSAGFSFGAPSGSALFGNSAAAPAAAPPMQASFSFGSSAAATPTAPAFSFGQAKAEQAATTTPPGTGFSFGQSKPAAAAPSTSGGMGFGFGAPKADAPAAAAFSFGAPAKPEAPAAALNGFSFGAPKVERSTSNGFSFGQKAEAPPSGGGFSFGASKPTPAPAIQTSLSFGGQKQDSAGGFSFGGPTSAPPMANSFSFGQPASNPGSAPGSPAAFTQPTPAFGFGSSPTVAPLNMPGNAFSFGAGSQPASPAPSNSGLPGGGGGFSFGAPAGTPPPSSQGAAQPFGATPPSGGGALFTMGSAAASPGARTVKKLPARRGVKR